MKKIILSLIISTSLLSANFFKEEDKQAHMAVTTIASIYGSLLAKKHGYSDTEAFWIGFGTAMVVGIAKEAYDEHSYGGWDNRDLLADAIGGVAGSSVSYIIYRF